MIDPHAPMRPLPHIMPTFKSPLLFAALLSCASAFAAPPCYDDQAPMVEAGPFWFDPAMSGEEQAGIVYSLAQAQANIVAAYGERLAAPRVIWCKTMACATYFSGTDGRSFANTGNGKRRAGAQYAFSFAALVITRQARYPKNIRAVEVLTHELSHIEMRARLRGVSVPAWFNEGLASYLGTEHACKPGTRGIADLFELDSPAKWTEYTNRESAAKTYCQAHNEVGAWIAEHGGFPAILQLLARRSSGTPFYSLYGRQHELLAPTPAT